MRFPAGGAENVLDFDSARHQSIGDQRAVTPPGDCFRAHDHRRASGCEIDEPGQTLPEGARLHVIGIASKAGVLPAGIDGILPGVPEPAQTGQMHVLNSLLPERSPQFILPELRIPARFRNRADIDELPDAMHPQYFEEFLDRKRRVADGEDRQGFTTVRRYERIAPSSASL